MHVSNWVRRLLCPKRLAGMLQLGVTLCACLDTMSGTLQRLLPVHCGKLAVLYTAA